MEAYIDAHQTLKNKIDQLTQIPKSFLEKHTEFSAEELNYILSKYTWMVYKRLRYQVKKRKLEEESKEEESEESKKEKEKKEKEKKMISLASLLSLPGSEVIPKQRKIKIRPYLTKEERKKDVLLEKYIDVLGQWSVDAKMLDEYGYVPTGNDRELIPDVWSSIHVDNNPVFLNWDPWSWKTELAKVIATMTANRYRSKLEQGSTWPSVSDYFLISCNIDTTVQEMTMQTRTEVWTVLDQFNTTNLTNKVESLVSKLIEDKKNVDEIRQALTDSWFTKEEIWETIKSLTTTASMQIRRSVAGILLAMQEGKVIILDEFNMLPIATQVWLNALLQYKVWEEKTLFGQTVKVKAWFGIIMTWNIWEGFDVTNRTALDSSVINRTTMYVKNPPTNGDLKVLMYQIMHARREWSSEFSSKWLLLTKHKHEEIIDKIDCLTKISDCINTKDFECVKVSEGTIPVPTSAVRKAFGLQSSLRDISDIITKYSKSPYTMEYHIYHKYLASKQQNTQQDTAKQYRFLQLCRSIWLFQDNKNWISCTDTSRMKEVIAANIAPYLPKNISWQPWESIILPRDMMAIQSYSKEYEWDLKYQIETIATDPTVIEMKKNTEIQKKQDEIKDKINELLVTDIETWPFDNRTDFLLSVWRRRFHNELIAIKEKIIDQGILSREEISICNNLDSYPRDFQYTNYYALLSASYNRLLKNQDLDDLQVFQDRLWENIHEKVLSPFLLDDVKSNIPYIYGSLVDKRISELWEETISFSSFNQEIKKYHKYTADVKLLIKDHPDTIISFLKNKQKNNRDADFTKTFDTLEEYIAECRRQEKADIIKDIIDWELKDISEDQSNFLQDFLNDKKRTVNIAHEDIFIKSYCQNINKSDTLFENLPYKDTVKVKKEVLNNLKYVFPDDFKHWDYVEVLVQKYQEKYQWKDISITSFIDEVKEMRKRVQIYHKEPDRFFIDNINLVYSLSQQTSYKLASVLNASDYHWNQRSTKQTDSESRFYHAYEVVSAFSSPSLKTLDFDIKVKILDNWNIYPNSKLNRLFPKAKDFLRSDERNKFILWKLRKETEEIFDAMTYANYDSFLGASFESSLSKIESLSKTESPSEFDVYSKKKVDTLIKLITEGVTKDVDVTHWERYYTLRATELMTIDSVVKSRSLNDNEKGAIEKVLDKHSRQIYLRKQEVLSLFNLWPIYVWWLPEKAKKSWRF